VDIPKLIWNQCLTYLLVLGGVAGAFVSGVAAGGFVPSLQPDNTTIVTPNSTIRVNNLFIVGVTFTKRRKRTSKIFPTMRQDRLKGAISVELANWKVGVTGARVSQTAQIL